MAALPLLVPFPVFTDLDGQPLDNGKVYIGTVNLDPVTNPIQVYYDEALTITASQPLHTSGGYIYRNGTPTNVYVNASEFSITVNDSKNLLVYTSLDGGPSGTWPINISGNAATATTAATATNATNVSGVVAIANGGTGQTTASNARTALGAAASGANTDITALDQDVTITATGTIAADSIGFRGLPQNSQTSSYVLVANDAGKHISITTGGVTIPPNSGAGSVAFPVGTAIVVFNNSGSNQTISITTDTLRLAGTSSTGPRTLAGYGMVTLVKVASNVWLATGNVT